MPRPLRALGAVAVSALIGMGCQSTPPPAPTIPAPTVTPVRSPTVVSQPPPAPTQRPLASGGGVRDLGSPVAAGGGAAATVAIPKPAVTLVPREPPPPFVAAPDPPSPGNANPIGPYLTPLPKPAALAGGGTGAGGTPGAGAGATGATGGTGAAAGGTGTVGGGTGGTGTGGSIAIATTGPSTALQPLTDVAPLPTPTLFRAADTGNTSTKR